MSGHHLAGGSDYDTLCRDFFWDIPQKFNIAQAACSRWAVQSPDKVALLHYVSGKTLMPVTYGWLEETSNRLANVLRARGVGRGDRVAVILPQTPMTAAVHMAIYKLAAVAVPMAMVFGPEAMRYRLIDSGARALILNRDSVAKLNEIRAELAGLEPVLATDGPHEGVCGLPGEIARASAAFEAVSTEAEDPAVLIYTSGTTGQPKGALHAHRVLLGHAPGVQFAHEFLPREGDRLWTPSDWAWIGGLFNVLLTGLYFGVPVVAHRSDKFDPELAWRLIGDLSIRNAFIPPTALKMMREAGTHGHRRQARLRTLFSGGEAVGPALQAWAQDEFGLAINEVYGQTECNLIVESCAEIGVSRPGAIGKPVPGHRVAVIDPATGAPRPPGEAGMIAVRRPDPAMFLRYWNDPGATQAKFVRDWMLTGDQGITDEDGYIRFLGRTDDIITSAGYRIGPGEVEDCLLRHPAVKLAAVVGKPDSLRTEVVTAFVTLNAGFRPGETLAKDIQSHVRMRLSGHEYPRLVCFRDELPLTATGKVMRRVLRESLISGR